MGYSQPMTKIHITGFEAVHRRLQKVNQAVEVAAQRSVKKVAVSVRATWARQIVEEINLPASVIKDAIRLHPSNRSTITIEVDSRNVASLGIGRRVRSVPVMRFKPRQTRAGVSVRIKKSQGRKLIKSAFIAEMKTGHEGVFYRLGKKRLPIEEAKTTAVEEMAMDVVPKIQAFATNKLHTVFQSQLDYELSKRKLK